LALNRRVRALPTPQEVQAETVQDLQGGAWLCALGEHNLDPKNKAKCLRPSCKGAKAKPFASIRVKGGTVVRDENSSLLLFKSTRPELSPLKIRFIPKSLRENIVAWHHVDKAHAGGERLYQLLRTKFWWPKMSKDIESWLKECFQCLIGKARQSHKHQQYSTFSVDGPHQAYEVDVYDPCIEGLHGYKKILVVVDIFHGYLILIALRTETATEIVMALYLHVFIHKGMPRYILTDDAPAFKGKVAEEFKQVTGVEWPRTAPYSHWQLGRAERRNVILDFAIRCLPSDSQNQWPYSALVSTMVAWNHCPSGVTGISPWEVELAKLPEGNEGFSAQPTEKKEGLEIGVPEAMGFHTDVESSRLYAHVKGLRDAQLVYNKVVGRLSRDRRAQAVERKKAEAKKKTPALSVNDRVICLRPTKKDGKSPKLQNQWSAGWVVQSISNGQYHCEKTDTGETCRVSYSHIKPDRRKLGSQSLLGEEQSSSAFENLDVVRPLFVRRQILALRDDDFLAEQQFVLAEFDSPASDPEYINVQYLGTWGTTLSASFQKAWIDHKDNKGMLSSKHPRTSKSVKRFSAKDIPVSDVITKVSLTKGGKLSADSKKKLKGWTPSRFLCLGPPEVLSIEIDDRMEDEDILVFDYSFLVN